MENCLKMKKIIISDFMEYNDPHNKLGNYHYANCFASDGYEVLWLSNPFNEIIYFKDKNDYKFKKEISSVMKHKLNDNIYGFAPYTKKLYGNYPFSKNANRVLNGERYIKPNISETLKKIGFDKVDVLWISNPKHYWLVNVVKYKKLVFRMPDDFTHMRAWPNSVKEIQDKLIDKADNIFITSDYLRSLVEDRNREALNLKNGVNFEFFNKQYYKPKEYESYSKIVVYVGAIKEWFDSELLLESAKSLVDTQFFIIGSPQIDISILDKLSNISFLGAKDYRDIPAYLQYADVGIIPFRVNNLTNAVNPIKLYEYCAAGLDVVTTNMKELNKLNAPIFISKDKDEFICNIKNALNRREKDRIKKIKSFAKDNSWGKRYEMAKSIIENTSI